MNPARNYPGVIWKEIECSGCGHKWQQEFEYAGMGEYDPAGNPVLRCPECGHENDGLLPLSL